MKRSISRAAARTVAIAAALTIGLSMSTGTSPAGIDSANSIVDRQDRTVEAIQMDTGIQFVPPLDGNPLSREWFHSGKAAWKISGPKAEDWSGTISVGYQVGFPAALNGKLRFSWYTPNLGVEVDSDPSLIINDLVPRAGVEVEVGFGPGIETIEAASGDISGTDGYIQMSGFHGTVTGVLGQLSIRPWVKIVTSNGDTVITYGPLWQI
ncbi:MspA family porin [Nocardia acididurans]|nr:MspA family porin [Nocardia acididurans]